MGTGVVDLEHAPVDLRVPFATTSVSVARRRLHDWMKERGTPAPAVEDARLLISELVGNSVRHAQPLPDGNLLISWTVDHRGLQVSVTDGGSSSVPRKVNASPAALTGRGMAIVEALADSWWTEQTRSRTTVHALLTLE